MKRGISPLIGTVLLIGFTIVLAALVFRWGGNFFQQQTGETSEEVEQVMTLTGVEIKVLDARSTNPSSGCEGLQLLIENEVNVPIDSFTIRVTTDQETTTGEIQENLPEYYSKWLNVNIDCTGKIEKIEVYPKVLINENLVISTIPIAIFVNQVRQSEELPLQGGSVITWENGILQVNDEPFFAIGMFHVNVTYGQPSPYEEAFRKLGDAGFNVVINQDYFKVAPKFWSPSVCNLKKEDECEFLLNQAEENNLMVISGMRPFFGESPPPYWWGPCELQTIYDCAINKSAFLGYSNADEPIWSYYQNAPTGTPDHETLMTYINDIRTNDSDHIVWTNFAPAHESDNLQQYIQAIQSYSDVTDIYTTSIHPLWHSDEWIGLSSCDPDLPGGTSYCILDNPNITIFGDFSNLFTTQIIEDGRPFWMILDHSYDVLFDNEGLKGINLTKKRFITYDSIINGATGILFWSWSYDEKADPSVPYWNDTKIVVAELNYLNGPLTTPTTELIVNNNQHIKTMVKEYNNKLYIFAINRAEETFSNEIFSLPVEYSSAEVLFEERTIPITSNQFIDDFSDYSIHIYEIT